MKNILKNIAIHLFLEKLKTVLISVILVLNK